MYLDLRNTVLSIIQNELVVQSQSPPAGDMRIAAFATAMYQLSESEKFKTAIERLYIAKPNVYASYVITSLFKATQKQLLVQYPLTYPLEFKTAAVWEHAITKIFSDTIHFEEFCLDLENRTVQSNVSERYKAFKLVLMLMKDRLGEMPSVLDVGCSRNHGLKKLALNLPFQPLEIASPLRIKGSTRIGLESHLNTLLRQDFGLSYGIGSDIVPIDMAEQASWVRNCSFYPGELLNTASVSEYDYLDNNEWDIVSFQQGDFVGKGLFGDDDYEGVFDAITVSAFMYQLSDAERKQVRANLRRYLRPGGIIIYQDFAQQGYVNSELDFEENWFSSHYPYRTLIEFEDKGEELFEVFRWQNGRCKRVMIGNDFYKVAEAGLSSFTHVR
ncbi:MAG: class I SAM-dependent methyltransferase [Candidatus Saccharibacteria bacterium]